MTMRSPTTAATIPHTSSVASEPRNPAPSTTPVCVSVRLKSRRIAGAIAASPRPVAAYAACAKTPADRTVQRYLGGGAGVEVTQLLDLLGVGSVTVLAGDLEHDRQVLQLRMREEDAEAFAHHALADVVVAVAVRAERRLRVVCMQRTEAIEADPLVDVAQCGVERFGVGDVDTGDVPVAGVQADAEPPVSPERVEDHGQLVDRAPDRPPGARRVLHQHPRPLVAAVEHLLERGDDTLETDLEPGAEVRADMEDHPFGVDRARRVDRAAHRVDALLVDRVVRRGEIDEVEAVHESRHAQLLVAVAKRLEVLRVVVRKPPGARALDEQLHDVRVHADRVVERLLNAARAVSAKQHRAKAKAFARILVIRFAGTRASQARALLGGGRLSSPCGAAMLRVAASHQSAFGSAGFARLSL